MISCSRIPCGAPLLATLALVFPFTGRGELIVSYAENPGIQFSTVSNVSVMTFDSLATGSSTNAPFYQGGVQIGAYSSLTVSNANQYGGANGSKFTTVSGRGQSTLHFTSPVAYFGLWWSAGDPYNVLDFKSGNTLLAEFTTANLLQALPAKYYGNPTNQFLGQNSREPYAFLNFFGKGTSFDNIVFTNSGSSGFESDNHTVRQAEYDPETEGRYPGVVFETINGRVETTVPEPGSFLLFSLGTTLLLVPRLLRKRD